MSVEGIIDRILSDARAKAEEIRNEAKSRVSAIIEDGKREAEKYFQTQRRQIEERYSREMEHAVLNRRLEQRKRVLQARQKWMDRAFETAYKKLVDQPFSEYGELMRNLINKVSTTKDEVIVFGQKGEEKDLKKIVDALNRESGCKFTLAAQRGNFPWGFVLRKGKIETSMSVDSLFRYKRNDLEQKAWELFNAS